MLPALWVLAAEALALPLDTLDPTAKARFELGAELEEQHDFDASTAHYEQVVALAPQISHLYWRIARNHFRATQRLPMADETGRKMGFEQVVDWASRGTARDAQCAECYLYEFIGVASLARMEGTWSSARQADRMKTLLDRALELGPSHEDGDWNHELANAYFAAGVFYKVVPDVPLAGWLLGARGDPELSREYYRKALALRSNRIDFRLSLGSTLLCEGRRHDDPERAEEGFAWIRGIEALESHLPTDEIDREHAAILLSHPERACDYSGEEWRRQAGR
jgi:tetratricopeptide (TPR) repeat protein